MIRIVMMALVLGSVLGIAASSLVGGFNIEGAMIGLTSIVCLAAITSFILFYLKRHVPHNEM